MKTKIVGSGEDGQIHVAGYPISKSVSPCFHRFILKSLAIPWTVSLLETVDTADLKAAMLALDFVSAAISLLLKTAVILFIDWLDDDAKALNTVNTIVICQKDNRKVLIDANTN